MRTKEASEFEYAKVVLKKVSFSRFILAKEFFKFLNQLNIHEKIQLKRWIKNQFKLEFRDLFLIAYLKYDSIPAYKQHANVA